MNYFFKKSLFFLLKTLEILLEHVSIIYVVTHVIIVW